MRKLSLAISMLLHILFFALIVLLSPSKEELRRMPHVITVVPLSPAVPLAKAVPEREKEPRLQVPIKVQPFVLPGDGRPEGGGDGKAGEKKADPLFPPRFEKQELTKPGKKAPAGSPHGGTELMPVPEKQGPVLAAKEPEKDQQTDSGRLKIAIDELARKWGTQSGKGNLPPPAFGSGSPVTALPFDAGGEGGIPGLPGMGGSGATAIGGSAFFDAKGYDITPWAKRVVYRIKRNWLYPPAVFFGIQDRVEIVLVIEKSGRIAGLTVANASPIQPFNQSAINALELSVPFPPLPDDFPNPSITAYLVFRFN